MAPGADRDRIRFVLGQEVRELDRVDPTLTVLDWLRQSERRTGGKEGCAEGDCGACSVLVGRLDDGKLRYEAVNACIRFVATLDGCHLVTVEDLRGADGALHPVQQALVDHQGTQCGFCTPGFVIALYALWLARPDPVIYLGRVTELRTIRETDAAIEIGAGISYTDAWAVLARHFPGLHELIGRVGGAQIRNAGTIGGNIANGSPIGDMPPPLIALDAELVLRAGTARRRLPLADFFLDYGRQDLAPGEFIEAVHVPKLTPDSRFNVYKVSKRLDEDISAVLGAFWLALGEDGVIRAARLAFGGMAATPKRAPAAEAALTGKPWSAATQEAAAQALTQDFQPISDWRASAAYRSRVAGNLLRRFHLDSTGAEAALRIDDRWTADHG